MLDAPGNTRQEPNFQNCSACKKQFLRTTDIFSGCTLVRYLYLAFQVPYIYDYVMNLCRQQAELIQNHENESV
jgi:hypothetical protein